MFFLSQFLISRGRPTPYETESSFIQFPIEPWVSRLALALVTQSDQLPEKAHALRKLFTVARTSSPTAGTLHFPVESYRADSVCGCCGAHPLSGHSSVPRFVCPVQLSPNAVSRHGSRRVALGKVGKFARFTRRPPCELAEVLAEQPGDCYWVRFILFWHPLVQQSLDVFL